jgi:hypothetical protein
MQFLSVFIFEPVEDLLSIFAPFVTWNGDLIRVWIIRDPTCTLEAISYEAIGRTIMAVFEDGGEFSSS